MFRYHPLIRVEDYAPFIGAKAVERIRQKAKPLQGLHVTHVNSTYYGGGVAMLLDSLTSLMNSVGDQDGMENDSRDA
jgi:trehalose synthase